MPISELDVPSSVDLLYQDRVDVPLYVPLMQGDVFTDVIVPGLGDSPQTVQIVMHPCSMRRGASLVERTTVSPVDPRPRITDHLWRNAARIMPLPRLHESDGDYAANLLDMSAVESAQLRRESRIASLSTEGVLLLQQRLIFHQTRLLVEPSRLHNALAPILTEMELQADWVEAAMDADPACGTSQILEAEEAFASWLDANDRELRSKLQQVDQHNDIRRRTRAEIRRLYK